MARPVRVTKMVPSVVRLLYAVDKHKPYSSTSVEGQLAAWQRVHRDVWGRESQRLVAKLAEDVARCESVGRRRFRHLEDHVPQEQVDEDQHEEAEEDEGQVVDDQVRRSSRRRSQPETPINEPTRPHKIRRSSAMSDVDRAVNEQLIDLLHEYMPHRAAKGLVVWQQILDALPPGNVLRDRTPHGLAMHFASLVRKLKSSSCENLSSTSFHKLQAYLEELKAQAQVDNQEARLPSAMSLHPPNSDSEYRAAVLSLAYHVVNQLDHRIKQVQENLHQAQDNIRMIAKKEFAIVSELLHYGRKSHSKKRKA